MDGAVAREGGAAQPGLPRDAAARGGHGMNEPCLPKSAAFPGTKSPGTLAVVVPWLLATTGVPESATSQDLRGSAAVRGWHWVHPVLAGAACAVPRQHLIIIIIII